MNLSIEMNFSELEQKFDRKTIHKILQYEKSKTSFITRKVGTEPTGPMPFLLQGCGSPHEGIEDQLKFFHESQWRLDHPKQIYRHQEEHTANYGHTSSKKKRTSLPTLQPSTNQKQVLKEREILIFPEQMDSQVFHRKLSLCKLSDA